MGRVAGGIKHGKEKVGNRGMKKNSSLHLPVFTIPSPPSSVLHQHSLTYPQLCYMLSIPRTIYVVFHLYRFHVAFLCMQLLRKPLFAIHQLNLAYCLFCTPMLAIPWPKQNESLSQVSHTRTA